MTSSQAKPALSEYILLIYNMNKYNICADDADSHNTLTNLKNQGKKRLMQNQLIQNRLMQNQSIQNQPKQNR